MFVKLDTSLVQWHVPIVLTLGRERQDDREFNTVTWGGMNLRYDLTIATLECSSQYSPTWIFGLDVVLKCIF